VTQAQSEIELSSDFIFLSEGRPCGVCSENRNVRNGIKVRWSLCGRCVNAGYKPVEKPGGRIEYAGPNAIFSGPDTQMNKPESS